jgi:hypothetical protein
MNIKSPGRFIFIILDPEEIKATKISLDRLGKQDRLGKYKA